jgi:23S rRNA (cytidine2498-2'-O)-methyltransferase
LDCIIVEPDQWWAGVHRAASTPSRWPGGVAPVEAPPGRISRAYLKMAEALAWSRLPVAAGDRCVEIGSAPGGACQALLDWGLHVTGIDPADMDPSLLQHPHFTHVKKRAADMKRREFRGVKWLMADSNVAPNHTLDTVEAIVTHREIHIRGLLLTLKLLNWDLAQQIPDYLARVRSWGYHYVAARQLAYNKQEICVAAMPQRSTRRQPRRSQRTQTPRNNLRHMSP